MDDQKQKILIVDDERFYINVLIELLSSEYNMVVTKDGTEAFNRALESPDLILLDVMMPGLNGYDICRQLKADDRTRDIPVIFLTVKNELNDEIRGFELGAVDYIAKPISPAIVKARVATHIALNNARIKLTEQKIALEEQVCERTKEICHAQDVAIYCLASLVETRDNETGFHIRRTQNYVRVLAEYLKDNPRFSAVLDEEYILQLYKSAPLHDIGKVGVADKILLKNGPLDGENWEEMKRHTLYGKEAIDRTEKEMGITPFLNLAKEITYTHHEKWDGSGYPRGLNGDEIPISGRLMAVADVYDALISKRAYKPAFDHLTAVEMIRVQKGKHFDPDVVSAFLALENKFKDISNRYIDKD